MKKDRKPIILLALVIAVASILCVKLTKNVKSQTLTVTDSDGMTYLAVVDQNNNVYAGVTDENGKLYGAAIDENGKVVTGDSMYYIGDYTGTLPVNNTTVVEINQSNAYADVNFADADVSRVENNTSDGDNKGGKTDDKDKPNNAGTTSGSDKKPQEKVLLGEKYQKLFESGTYLMKFTTDDPEMPYEVTTAFKNGNLYFDTTVEGMACQVIYLSEKKEGYMVVPTLRMYCTLPEDMMADMSSTMISAEGEANAVYEDVETYDVVIGDKKCVAENYKYDDGTGKIYYFYNENLVRMDFVEEDGTTTVYSISAISSDVPDSYFTLPKGYMKINLAWLMSQAEEESTAE